MGPRPTEGDEKHLGPATTLCRTVALSFVIPTGAERRDLRFYGSFVGMSLDEAKRLADLSPNRCFTERSRRACPERSRRNPEDAGWPMLFTAFRPPKRGEKSKNHN